MIVPIHKGPGIATSLSCLTQALPPGDRARSSPRDPRQHLESVLERDHVAVGVATHFKLARTDLERPSALGFLVAKLEAEPEVTGVFRHAAEGVHRAVGVGCAVILEPLFCRGR
jgi:hypothetical protein